MASKKTRKITKAPSGVSFMYVPAAAAGKLRHAWHKRTCGGVVRVIGRNRTSGANRPDALIYGCSKCSWKSPSGNFSHEPTTPTRLWPKRKPMKKQHPVLDPVELRDAIRREHARRMRILIRERKKFPPTLIEERVKATRGKDKGKIISVWHDNPDFTESMRDHMHRYAVDAIEIRDCLKAGDPLPEYPAPVS